MTNFVPFSRHDLEDVLINDMGFHIKNIPNVWEFVYERDVTTTSGTQYPYYIRVYSTVHRTTQWTRDCGNDSIKIQLIDKATGRPVPRTKMTRVHRTKNAMTNLRKRAREAFSMVLDAEQCPCCGAIMNEQTNRKTKHKFLSCTRFSPNADYHCTGTRQIKEAA